MFDNCTRYIFEYRGDTMTPKEVIHLETSLLNLSLLCYPRQMYHISCCLGVCVTSLREKDNHGAFTSARQENDPINVQAPMSNVSGTRRTLNEVGIEDLEKLLSIPLDYLVALL